MQINTQGRFNEKFATLIPIDEILATDIRGTMLRLLNQRKTGARDAFRNTDNPEFRYIAQKRTNDLEKKDLKSHILFRNNSNQIPETELIEETLFWDIKSEMPLEGKASEAIINLYNKIQTLPPEASHPTFPLHIIGYLLGHSIRVAVYSALLAKKMNESGMNGVNPETAAIAGLCHDLGKLQEGQKKLTRIKGRFSPEQFNKIKLHPILGATAFEYLKKSEKGKNFPLNEELFQPIFDAILKHHVRPDDNKKLSYPRWINEKELTPLIQTVTIADCYDAMTSRSYRTGNTATEEKIARAFRELQEHKATQFNPKLTDLFLEIAPKPTFYEVTYPEVE